MGECGKNRGKDKSPGALGQTFGMTPDSGKPHKRFSTVRGMHLADLFTLAIESRAAGRCDDEKGRTSGLLPNQLI